MYSLTIKELSKVNMQTKSVVKNGVICLMALENPKDFDNGISVMLDKFESNIKIPICIDNINILTEKIIPDKNSINSK